MDRKYQRMTEGTLYLFSLPRGTDKAAVMKRLENELAASDCGRVLGSGMSCIDDGTVVIEIGAYDRDEGEVVITDVCRKLKCHDFELVWD